MDLKKQAAKQAVAFIKDNSVIGLGAGSSVAYLIEFLQTEIDNGLHADFVTSSSTTLSLLLKNGFRVKSAEYVESVDIYFDGCDQLDEQLNALKSGGGIHTQEKLIASMAHEFILLGDDVKYVPGFDVKFPLVIEVLPQAIQFVPGQIKKLFADVRTVTRFADKKDGYVITTNGNYLVDIFFNQWPELSSINPLCKSVTGIVETSLFYKMAHRAVIASEGAVKIVEPLLP